MIRTILIAPPAEEPVSLAEAKAHLRLDAADEDSLVAAMIAAARAAVETDIRRVLVSQDWRLVFDRWPEGGDLVVPVAPLISVAEIRALDAAGAATIVPAQEYEVQADRDAIVLEDDAPTVATASGFEIDMTAGYGAAGADVPGPLRQAVQILVARWYERRAAVAAGDEDAAGAEDWRQLVAPWRRLRLK